MADYQDPLAGIVRKYNLLYYPSDNSIEMVCTKLLIYFFVCEIFWENHLCFGYVRSNSTQVDLKTRRLYVKGVKAESLSVKDLFVGASVNILGRQLVLVDYADEYTRRLLGSAREQTVVVIFVEALGSMGQIIEQFNKDSIMPSMRMVNLSPADAEGMAPISCFLTSRDCLRGVG